MKNKNIEWFLRHSLAVISGALIIGAGITFVVWATAPATTIIGEDIITRDIAVTRDLIAETGRTATFVVAASDSLPQNKAQADFVADGVDDHLTIQAAIDALPPGGGKVLLMEGAFHIDFAEAGNRSLFIRRNTHLSGSGEGTVLRLVDNAKAVGTKNTFILYDNVRLTNFVLDGNRVNQPEGSHHDGIVPSWKGTNGSFGSLVQGITSKNFAGEGIAGSGRNHRIIGNLLINNIGDGIGPNHGSDWVIANNIVLDSPGGIDLFNMHNSSVIGNIVRHTGPTRVGTGLDLHGGSTFNTFQGNVLLNLATAVRIYGGAIHNTHNTFQNNTIRGAGSGFRVESPHNKTSGNTLENVASGFWIRGEANFTKISGNYIINTTGTGVQIDGVNDSKIIGNRFFGAFPWGILLVRMDSTRTIVENNFLDRDPLVEDIPPVGISIASTAVDTQVRNNHLANAATTPISDAGTNTLIEDNIGHVTENTGIAIFSGDGAATTFTVAHGMAGDLIPTVVNLEAKSADAAGNRHWSADATNITVTFITAPPAGTNNIVISWEAKVR